MTGAIVFAKVSPRTKINLCKKTYFAQGRTSEAQIIVIFLNFHIQMYISQKIGKNIK